MMGENMGWGLSTFLARLDSNYGCLQRPEGDSPVGKNEASNLTAIDKLIF